jgi:predicted RNase H-like HicB family nuclease
MLNYVALVHQDKKGANYGVSFPDLPGCVTSAETLDELYDMAAEAASFHLEGMMEDKEAIPEPMDLDQALQHPFAKKSCSSFIVRIGRPDKQERINISLAELDLVLIDRAADQAGETRSAFLVQSALVRVRNLHHEKSSGNL